MSRRFAGHLGVRGPDAPLLQHMAGSADPLEQIRLMADLGFAGIFDNYLLLRDEADQARIGAELRRLNMDMGSFVHDPLRWDQPAWIDGTALASLDRTIAAAARSGAASVTCITAGSGDPAADRRAMADMLRRAAERLSPEGPMLCVEATHPAFAPGLLIEQVEDALEVVRMANHPKVRLALDLGHGALHGRDPVELIRLAAGLIGNVQIADLPGRVEPGAGSLDWPSIFAALDAAGYGGLLELECEPLEKEEAGERAMVARLAGLGLGRKA
ncbi:MAG: TIM barrel protein [Rhizorhabdus sp.]|uniref:TIM barrel protein n=1 Tax=Rhizorhabdus sp. TaxID=1968843 RepID=UPI001B4E849F|nr:TIM barrel protein [Rhizorhabdus sp.]MBP8232519.1 TIM barrel protein [Rhizorhabdus sp.]